MYAERIEKLKQEYTGQYVTIDSDRPGLARFRGIRGQVRTVNFDGRALVEFDGVDRTWYDLELDHLKVIGKSEPIGTEETLTESVTYVPASNKPEPTDDLPPTQKLSRLELARLHKAGTDEK